MLHPSALRLRIVISAVIWYLIDLRVAQISNGRRRMWTTAILSVIRIAFIITLSGRNEDRAARIAARATVTELDRIWADRNAPPTHG